MDDEGAFAKLVQMFTGGTGLPTLKYRDETPAPGEKEASSEDDYKEGNEDVEMNQGSDKVNEAKSKTVFCYCKIKSPHQLEKVLTGMNEL